MHPNARFFGQTRHNAFLHVVLNRIHASLSTQNIHSQTAPSRKINSQTSPTRLSKLPYYLVMKHHVGASLSIYPYQLIVKAKSFNSSHFADHRVSIFQFESCSGRDRQCLRMIQLHARQCRTSIDQLQYIRVHVNNTGYANTNVTDGNRCHGNFKMSRSHSIFVVVSIDSFVCGSVVGIAVLSSSKRT